MCGKGTKENYFKKSVIGKTSRAEVYVHHDIVRLSSSICVIQKFVLMLRLTFHGGPQILDNKH